MISHTFFPEICRFCVVLGFDLFLHNPNDRSSELRFTRRLSGTPVISYHHPAQLFIASVLFELDLKWSSCFCLSPGFWNLICDQLHRNGRTVQTQGSLSRPGRLETISAGWNFWFLFRFAWKIRKVLIFHGKPIFFLN